VTLIRHARALSRRLLSPSTRRTLTRLGQWPPVGHVRFGSLRRASPISATFGLERGKPLDRYYIERFLAAHSVDIHGRVMEIGTDMYTQQFGGTAVTESDVLHVVEEQEPVTITGDLTDGRQIPSNAFDCVILTQTLQFIYDVEAAVQTVWRILKPGGVVLATVSGISQISRYDMDHWGHFWSMTTASARKIFESAFPAGSVEVEAYGNVLAAISFLHGIAAGELTQSELNHLDPDYEVLISVRAEKEIEPQ